ncbi:aldehyde dehydrogenase family protein, partial [Hyalangium sp.]|uniref:aldehyde dehydrogenase family protein n=1 Tax=Hyalangium sp. TaxID=2028555 RepID=UPI002D3DCFAE
MSSLFEDLFSAEVPASARIPEHTEQREYLVDGKLLMWQGELSPVRSPVCVKTPQGLEQKIIGATPLLTSRESLAALDGAVRAYDLGRGVWPTMRVAERIEHVERFIARMQEQRQPVVNLLMWEIGKTQKDAEKEFDRTRDYLVDTLHALKELDRNSARFVQ